MSHICLSAKYYSKLIRLPNDHIIRKSFNKWKTSANKINNINKYIWFDHHFQKQGKENIAGTGTKLFKRSVISPFNFIEHLHNNILLLNQQSPNSQPATKQRLTDKYQTPWDETALNGIAKAHPTVNWPVFGAATVRTIQQKKEATDYAENLDQKLNENHNNPNDYIIYTDGAATLAYSKNIIRDIIGGWSDKTKQDPGGKNFNGKGVGAGYAIKFQQNNIFDFHIKQSHPLPSVMDSFLAELSAIQLSLHTIYQYLRTNQIQNHNNIIIVSDNQTVVNTLITNSISKQPIATLKPPNAHSILQQINNIKTHINNFNNNSDVTFKYEWVPGHTDSKDRQGCEGNKLADELADKAATDSFSTPMDQYTLNNIPVPINKDKAEIKRRVTLLWRTLRHKFHRIRQQTTIIDNNQSTSDDNYLTNHIFWAGTTKNWAIPNFDHRNRWRAPPKHLTERTNRNEEIAIARIRQGYTYTNDFLTNKYSTWYKCNQCPYCNNSDSITHRIFHCTHPPIQNARQDAFKELIQLLQLPDNTTEETMLQRYFTTELLLNHNALDIDNIPKTDFVNISPETAKSLSSIFCNFLSKSKLIKILSQFKNHCH